MYKRKGQSILEYAMLLAVIVAVIVAIQIYVKRSVEGKLKASADQMGEQFTTNETNTVQTIRQTARKEQTLGLDVTPTEGGAWSQSTIQVKEGADWANQSLGSYVKKAGDYKGAEISATDYVTATKGAGAVGAHGTFDSGKISDKKLFDDD